MNTFLTINANDFDYVDQQTYAVNLFQELLWAEATSIGLPLGNINISLKINVPDGGVDASARKPPDIHTSNVIIDEYNVYQIKAGSSFRPWEESAIRKELFGKEAPDRANLGSMVQDCLAQNGSYILVCFGHDLTDDQRNRAINHLKGFLEQHCQYENPKVDVWSRSNLASFLTPYPSMILGVRGRARNFQTHQEWGNDDSMRLTFIPGEAQNQQINALQDVLRQNNFHSRITGEPGIGKTRLVFEATKANELRPLVLYCIADLFYGSDLMHDLLRADNNYHVILVLDECNADKRTFFSNKFAHLSPRIKIVSIYSEPDGNGSYLMVDPLSEVEISKIIQEYLVPEDRARKWASVCGGSPRVAHVVGRNLLNNPEDMLREPDTERVWDRYIESDSDPNSIEVHQRRLILMYLSLFKRFGFGQPVRIEAESIQKLIQQHDPSITWNNFTGIVRNLQKLKILQGENTLYITPKLLHIKLWVDWWDNFGLEFIVSDILNQTGAPLLDWFFEMFEYAAGSEAATRKVRELLGADGLFQSQPEILNTERGARFFHYLGEVKPEVAVKCLQNTIGKWDSVALLEFKAGRREIVWLLEKTAQWRELFVPSANLLLALAEAENETWSNNATGIFVELFSMSWHPKLSPTEAPPDERFPVLAAALSSASGIRRSLALQACRMALSPRTFGSVSERLHFFRREPVLWTPTSWAELSHAYQQIWNLLLNRMDELSSEERKKTSEILVERIIYLGTIPEVAEGIANDVLSLVAKSYLDDQNLLQKVIRLLRFGNNLTPDLRSVWEQVKENLSGDDYHSSMKRFVKMNLTEDHFDEEGNRTSFIQEKIQDLAQKSFKNPALLTKELPWLVTRDAINGYQFGYSLSQEDKSFSLLKELIDAQKSGGENASLYFLGGYLRGLLEDNLQAWEDLLDDFAQESSTAIWILELTQRAGHITNQAAKRIISVLEKYEFPSWLLNQFMYGGILNGLQEGLFIEWIKYLLDQQESIAVYVALGLYSTYYTGSYSVAELPADLTIRLLTNEAFSEIPEDFSSGNNRVMYPFYWKLVAERFMALYPNRNLELSAFMFKYFSSFNVIFAESAPRSVLRAIVTSQPREVWAQITSYLEDGYDFQLTHWLRGDNFFGQPREEDIPILPLIPQDEVWKWVEEDVEGHAWRLATFVPPVLDREIQQLTWARELLIRYGQSDDVRNNLIANFFTEGWKGPQSEHLMRKMQILLDYKKTETNDNVNQWLDELLEEIERRIANARIQEERRDF